MCQISTNLASICTGLYSLGSKGFHTTRDLFGSITQLFFRTIGQSCVNDLPTLCSLKACQCLIRSNQGNFYTHLLNDVENYVAETDENKKRTMEVKIGNKIAEQQHLLVQMLEITAPFIQRNALFQYLTGTDILLEYLSRNTSALYNLQLIMQAANPSAKLHAYREDLVALFLPVQQNTPTSFYSFKVNIRSPEPNEIIEKFNAEKKYLDGYMDWMLRASKGELKSSDLFMLQRLAVSMKDLINQLIELKQKGLTEGPSRESLQKYEAELGRQLNQTLESYINKP